MYKGTNVFRCVQMHSDTYTEQMCIQMCLDIYKCVQTCKNLFSHVQMGSDMTINLKSELVTNGIP